MSVSVPNLTSSNMEATVSLLESFASVASRRPQSNVQETNNMTLSSECTPTFETWASKRIRHDGRDEANFSPPLLLLSPFPPPPLPLSPPPPLPLSPPPLPLLLSPFPPAHRSPEPIFGVDVGAESRTNGPLRLSQRGRTFFV